MKKEQEDIIRQKAEVSEWFQPETQDVLVRHIIFDAHDLLPDENVEAFLKECPQPAGWKCFDCDGSIDDWYFAMPYEQQLWASTVTITRKEQTDNTSIEKLKCYKTEQAMIALISALEQLTDYTYRKTEAEMQEMQDEVERMKQAGPPVEQV